MVAQSVLFLTKPNDHYCQVAEDFLRRNFEKMAAIYTTRDKPLPESAQYWERDWIISYNCRKVIPQSVLDKARKGAINFHPAPPEYPGSGGTNQALYDGSALFGVTCHKMLAQVDSGPIIALSRFPIYETDNVWSLTQRAYAYQLALFYDVMDLIINDLDFVSFGPTWGRKPYKLADFHALRRITPDMDEAEIKRRIRATVYPGGDGPYIELAGYRFELR